MSKPATSEFFMLWVDGKGPPTRTHATEEEAQKEAQRLLSEAGAKAVILLKAIKQYQFPSGPPLAIQELKPKEKNWAD